MAPPSHAPSLCSSLLPSLGSLFPPVTSTEDGTTMRWKCLVPGVPAAATICSLVAPAGRDLPALSSHCGTAANHLPTFLCGLSEMDFSSTRSWLGMWQRQDTLRREQPLMGWFHPGSRLSPHLRESRSGFSTPQLAPLKVEARRNIPTSTQCSVSSS